MYKYNLHYLLRQLSYNDYEIAMKWIPERMCISQRTFKSWIYAKDDSSIEIRYSQLELLASFFQCEISELVIQKHKRSLWEEFKEITGLRLVEEFIHVK